MNSLEDLLEAVRSWRSALREVVPPPGIPASRGPGPSLEALSHIERRIAAGNRSPVRVALFGPTGAGKSKLFNSLAGEVLSPASFRRPFTRRSVYFIHERRADLAAGLDGEVRTHRREGWEDLVLIDSPDFDSVEAENRARAERVYLEADAFLFVTDVHKYADASTWSYLERIRAEGKACVFVLNKVSPPGARAGGDADGDDDDPRSDFRARLEEAFGAGGLPGPLISIERRPQGDEELLPADDPGLVEVRRALERFRAPGPAGPALLAESFRIDLGRFLAEWDAFAGPLRRYREGIERLRAEVGAVFEREARELETDLQAEVDPGLKGEVYREVLKRIERIDVLRFPRRLLALPATGIRAALGRFWPRFRGGPASDATPVRPAGDAVNLAALRLRVQAAAEAVRAAFRAEAACPGLLDESTYRSLRVAPAALEGRYREVSAAFRAWAEENARSTASALTTENKAKFILSQVIYNTVVIGVQVKMAGTLTLTEMFTDGILSPLVAKAVGMAVSSERVGQFEEEARREYTRRLVEVMGEERDRFAAFLGAIGAGLAAVERIAPGVEGLRTSSGALVARFREARA